MHLLIISLILMISMIFLKMNHPLTMGLLLMIQTIFISLFSGLITKTFWFSYSLFLIFLGGMLILFMYMTSIAANEMFKLTVNMNFLVITFVSLMTIILLLFTNDFKNFFLNKIQSMDAMNIMMMKNLTLENNLTLNKLYSFPTNIITVLLVNYLFLTLIATVKITNIFIGPLRSKF